MSLLTRDARPTLWKNKLPCPAKIRPCLALQKLTKPWGAVDLCDCLPHPQIFSLAPPQWKSPGPRIPVFNTLDNLLSKLDIFLQKHPKNALKKMRPSRFMQLELLLKCKFSKLNKDAGRYNSALVVKEKNLQYMLLLLLFIWCCLLRSEKTLLIKSEDRQKFSYKHKKETLTTGNSYFVFQMRSNAPKI